MQAKYASLGLLLFFLDSHWLLLLYCWWRRVDFRVLVNNVWMTLRRQWCRNIYAWSLSLINIMADAKSFALGSGKEVSGMRLLLSIVESLIKLLFQIIWRAVVLGGSGTVVSRRRRVLV